MIFFVDYMPLYTSIFDRYQYRKPVSSTAFVENDDFTGEGPDLEA
jgi:hypothetical protein